MGADLKYQHRASQIQHEGCLSRDARVAQDPQVRNRICARIYCVVALQGRCFGIQNFRNKLLLDPQVFSKHGVKRYWMENTKADPFTRLTGVRRMLLTVGSETDVRKKAVKSLPMSFPAGPLGV